MLSGYGTGIARLLPIVIVSSDEGRKWLPISVVATGWQQTLSRAVELPLHKLHMHLLCSTVLFWGTAVISAHLADTPERSLRD